MSARVRKQLVRFARTFVGATGLLALAASAGCAPVRPWQRARLAAPAMAIPLAPSALDLGYRSKVLESKTGGGLPGVPAGGGCGCTQ